MKIEKTMNVSMTLEEFYRYKVPKGWRMISFSGYEMEDNGKYYTVVRVNLQEGGAIEVSNN